jgi:hypothetical protein
MLPLLELAANGEEIKFSDAVAPLAQGLRRDGLDGIRHQVEH